MPLYDFRCLDCQKKFEISLKLEELDGASKKKNCPHCYSEKTEKVISFKGAVINKGRNHQFGREMGDCDSCENRDGSPKGVGANGCGGGGCGYGYCGDA